MDGAHELVGFDELNPRLKRSVYWGFLWRGLVAALCSGIAGAIAGGVLGFLWSLISYALGVPTNIMLLKLVAGAVGLIFGLIVWWEYVRWLFSANLGGFRLRLAREVTDAV